MNPDFIADIGRIKIRPYTTPLIRFAVNHSSWKLMSQYIANDDVGAYFNTPFRHEIRRILPHEPCHPDIIADIGRIKIRPYTTPLIRFTVNHSS